jgi:hypothetical protein
MCCIIIPIYKDKLSEYEIKSLKQCCIILGKYPIFFVTHNKLDCKIYNTICDEINVVYRYEYFNKIYFSDILCYNALLLSKYFYTRFNNYEYMLIYQLDAYVFKNELEYWCKKGYDYIGAPWLRLNTLKTTPVFYDPPIVGNGGFSLRNVKRFMELYNKKICTISFINLFKSFYNKISLRSRKNIIYFIPRFFLRPLLKILRFVFFKYSELDNNEDVVWSNLFQKKGKVPSEMEAMQFSFENFPEYLYQLNNNTLPFGCHEWYNYHNYSFYNYFIQ